MQKRGQKPGFVRLPYDGPVRQKHDNAEASIAASKYYKDPADLRMKKKKLSEITPSKRHLQAEHEYRAPITRPFNHYMEQLEDPRSFINVLPPFVRDSVLQVPEEYLNLDEDRLLEVLSEKHDKWKPTAAVEALRTNFWMEFDRASLTRNEIMNQNAIFLGVVSYEQWKHIVKYGFHVLAYILCRPPEYEAVMRGLLNLSTRRIRDILNIPVNRPDGTIQDAKVLDLVLKAAAMVDLRAKGGYIQRSETKNLTMMRQETTNYTTIFSPNTKSVDVAEITTEIDKKIAALEQEMASVTAPGITHQVPEPLPSITVEAREVKKDGEIA